MNNRGVAGVALVALVCSLVAIILSALNMYRTSIQVENYANQAKADNEARIEATRELTKAIKALARAQETENRGLIGK